MSELTFVNERSLRIHQAGNASQLLVVNIGILLEVVKVQVVREAVQLRICQRLSEEGAHFGYDTLQILQQRQNTA